MQELISLNGNVISYSENSLDVNIEDILSTRFIGLEDTINPSISELYDPYLLRDMDKAVKRIKEAKEKNEKVIIFGDYDVDGVTSTSLLMHFFVKIGINASYRLPHRVKDGYGLKTYFIDELENLGVDLIVTVDCGSRDIDVIRYAKEKGIDVIITDHHTVPEDISEVAVAIINPKRLDCEYPNKNLSGAGVVFKLIHALSRVFFSEEESLNYIKSCIDIVAVGTVSDCMDIMGENRIIVREGLKQIKNSRSIGLRRLVEDKANEELDSDYISFSIGPKLNAAGRLDTAYKAVNLILNNGDTINKIIHEIEELNEKRKYLTKTFVEDALSRIKTTDNIIFYISPAIDNGIIGIIAGKLSEMYYKPCICLKDEGDKLVASVRSPEYFSIIELLTEYKDMFVAFGGHKQAAGFTITREKFSDFKTSITEKINSYDFKSFKKTLNVDKLIKPEDIGFRTLLEVEKFRPFGMGNKKPIFMIKDLDYMGVEFMGDTRNHLRFTNKYGLKIIAFGMGNKISEIVHSNKKPSIVFELEEDNWNGSKKLMLNIIDIALI